MPVRMTSPGSRVMKRERSATESGEREQEPARVPLLHDLAVDERAQAQVVRAGPRRRQRAAPRGVKPSCPFARTLEPRSAQRRSYTPRSFAGATQPMQRSASSIVTRRAALPITIAISPSKQSSSQSARPDDRFPVRRERRRRLEEVRRKLGHAAPLLGPAPVVQVHGDDLRRRGRCGRSSHGFLSALHGRGGGSASRQNAIRSPPFRFGRCNRLPERASSASGTWAGRWRAISRRPATSLSCATPIRRCRRACAPRSGLRPPLTPRRSVTFRPS